MSNFFKKIIYWYRSQKKLTKLLISLSANFLLWVAATISVENFFKDEPPMSFLQIFSNSILFAILITIIFDFNLVKSLFSKKQNE